MERALHSLILTVLILTIAFTAILTSSEATHAQTGFAPAAPTLTAAAQASAITVSWTAVDGAARYELQRWEESAGAWVRISDALTGTTYSDSDVEAGKTYYYSVRALTADGGKGAWSGHSADNTHATVAAPGAATELTEKDTGAGSREQSISGRDHETDRAALVALYNAAGGASWTNNTNWLSARPLGEWHGVTTDGSGRVSELILDNNQLSGSIPSELGNLTNLTKLRLHINRLSGSIPPELGNLTNLEGLALTGNQLSGNIPSELGNLANLTELHLDNNQLSGSIPSELGNLSNLTKLRLHINRLSGSIPPELGNLTNLEGLALTGNQLSGNIPPNWATSPTWNGCTFSPTS